MAVNERIMGKSYYLANGLANGTNSLIIRVICIFMLARRLVRFAHMATKFGIIYETEVPEFSVKEYTIFVRC